MGEIGVALTDQKVVPIEPMSSRTPQKAVLYTGGFFLELMPGMVKYTEARTLLRLARPQMPSNQGQEELR